MVAWKITKVYCTVGSSGGICQAHASFLQIPIGKPKLQELEVGLNMFFMFQQPHSLYNLHEDVKNFYRTPTPTQRIGNFMFHETSLLR